MVTPKEKSIHDLALMYVDKKVGVQSPPASLLAQTYIEAYIEIEKIFKQKQFDPLDDAPPWPDQ